KIEAEHRPDPVEGQVTTQLPQGLTDSVLKELPDFFETTPAVETLHFFQLGYSSSKCERIARQSTRLVNRTVRSKHIHNFGLAAKRSHRQPATDDLAHCGEVRGDPDSLLNPSPGQ